MSGVPSAPLARNISRLGAKLFIGMSHASGTPVACVTGIGCQARIDPVDTLTGYGFKAGLLPAL